MQQKANQTILEIVEDITFLPSPEQRKAKAAFWASYSENPLVGLDVLTVSDAVTLSRDRRVRSWWSLPSFREWFLNQDEFRQRLEYLANLALDTAESILLDTKAHPSARANMVKLVIEAAGRMPNKFAKEKYIDERIGSMDRKQLEEYIRRASRYIPSTPQQEEASSESESDSGSPTPGSDPAEKG